MGIETKGWKEKQRNPLETLPMVAGLLLFRAFLFCMAVFVLFYFFLEPKSRERYSLMLSEKEVKFQALDAFLINANPPRHLPTPLPTPAIMVLCF